MARTNTNVARNRHARFTSRTTSANLPHGFIGQFGVAVPLASGVPVFLVAVLQILSLRSLGQMCRVTAPRVVALVPDDAGRRCAVGELPHEAVRQARDASDAHRAVAVRQAGTRPGPASIVSAGPVDFRPEPVGR